jgi:chromosome segregation ATPase
VGWQEEMESLKQEFQKFRVKAEVSRSQSATEITRLSETNLKYKQFNVSSNDVLNELEACRKRIETLEQTRAGNEAENQRLAERLQQEAAAREHAAQEAREWKLRAEVVGPHAMQQAVGALRAELRELQDECHNLRVVAERGAREKEDALRQVSRLAQTRTDNIDLAYLRDIVLKYLMTQDEKSRAPMEAAITAVLRFAPEELERIRAAKRGWFGV